jgi:hypothetical protein
MSNVPRVVIDSLPAMYASHFLLTINEECLLIESAAGLAAAEAGALPINCRLAVPWNAARRLAAVLNSAIAQRTAQGSGDDPPTAAADGLTAQLPPLQV